MVEASAAEAEAISATLAAAKARQINGEVEQLPDRDRGSEATPSGKPISSMDKVPDPFANNTPPAGVRLHHRAVSVVRQHVGYSLFLSYQSTYYLLALYSHISCQKKMMTQIFL